MAWKTKVINIITIRVALIFGLLKSSAQMRNGNKPNLADIGLCFGCAQQSWNSILMTITAHYLLYKPIRKLCTGPSFGWCNWCVAPGPTNTLKNKGASRCHRRTFLGFNKEPLTSEEPFCFTKGFFVMKEGSSDYKKVRKRWFFKETLVEWHRCEEPAKHLYI